MRFLVTGGAGFIGSHVVEYLVGLNHVCIVLDDFSTGLRPNIPCEVQLYQRDIRDAGLTELMIDEKIDLVIHLAGQTMVPVSLDNPGFDCAVNVLGTVNLLEACRLAAVKRVVFASTAAVYGMTEHLPISEPQAGVPISFYGLSKYTGEQYLQLYWRQFGLSYVVLRFANVYGERQGDGGEGGVISIFANKIRCGEPVTIFGDGLQTRDFIYAGDVARAIFQACISTYANTAYNISTQLETTVNELVECMETIAGEPVLRQYAAVRTGDITRSVLSNQAAISHLGWQPQTSLREGLQRTFHSLKLL